jgi:hypothetical protein
MATTNYLFLAPKIGQMIQQADKLSHFGVELKKILNESHKQERGVFSALVFPVLESLAEQCEEAKSILQSRIEELFKVHKEHSYSTYKTLLGDEKEVRFWNLAKDCEIFISSDGSEQFNKGWQALEISATQSKSEKQLHFLKELVVLGTGVVSHPVGAALHAGSMLVNWDELTKAKQLEIGLNKTSVGLLALDELYENIENLCLFMYFIPISSDAKNTVTELAARARFRESVRLQ